MQRLLSVRWQAPCVCVRGRAGGASGSGCSRTSRLHACRGRGRWRLPASEAACARMGESQGQLCKMLEQSTSWPVHTDKRRCERGAVQTEAQRLEIERRVPRAKRARDGRSLRLAAETLDLISSLHYRATEHYRYIVRAHLRYLTIASAVPVFSGQSSKMTASASTLRRVHAVSRRTRLD